MSVCEFQKVGWDHQNIPVKLSDFLQHLESKGEVKLKLANHIITRTEAEDGPASFAIAPDQDCAFKLTGSFPKSRSPPTVKDAGAFIDFLSSKDSPNVTWLISFTSGTQREREQVLYHLHKSAFLCAGMSRTPLRSDQVDISCSRPGLSALRRGRLQSFAERARALMPEALQVVLHDGLCQKQC